MRIGNIEIRQIETQQYFREWEIVCWYPNPYYGKESQYKHIPASEGHPDYYINEYGVCISKGCFKNPESCYVVSWAKQSVSDEEPDIVSVGRRPYELVGKEKEDYEQLIKHIYEEFDNLYQ